MLESSLHSGLAIGYGSPLVFFYRPISASLLACAAIVIISSVSGGYIRRKLFSKNSPF
jgi:TctA family transporter